MASGRNRIDAPTPTARTPGQWLMPEAGLAARLRRRGQGTNPTPRRPAPQSPNQAMTAFSTSGLGATKPL
jgi:hypothetical protein